MTSIEYNHKPVESARKGQEVCVKIEPIPGEAPKMFGRHFDEKDFVVSKVGSFNFIIRPQERVEQRFTRHCREHYGQLLNSGNVIPHSSFDACNDAYRTLVGRFVSYFNIILDRTRKYSSTERKQQRSLSVIVIAE